MKFKEYYLIESKQVGIIYHLVDFKRLKYILDTNSIKSQNFTNVSTTRNKMMNYYGGSPPQLFFKLEIDGDKLSNNYKIKPFSYVSGTGVNFDEKEENIKTQEIKNIKKYINKIIIIKENIEQYLKYLTKEEIKKQIETILALSEGIPIFIQDGVKIYKSENLTDDLGLNKLNWIEKLSKEQLNKYLNHHRASDKIKRLIKRELLRRED